MGLAGTTCDPLFPEWIVPNFVCSPLGKTTPIGLPKSTTGSCRLTSGAAKSLITIAMKRPDVLLEVFGKVA